MTTARSFSVTGMVRTAMLFAALVFAAGLTACADDSSDPDGGTDDRETVTDGGDGQSDAGGTDGGRSGGGDGGERRPRDTGGGFDWDTGDDADAADEPFELREVVPPTGPVEGGNRVRLVGTGFEPGTRVYLGGNRMEVDVTTGELVGQAPEASGPGPVSVKVLAPDGETETLEGGYEYVEDLRLESVSPRRIPVDGGVELDMRGEGFRSGMAVSFDGVSARRVEVRGDEHMRVVAPEGESGSADVRLTTAEESVVLEDAVEYFSPLQIERVRPASGSVGGGESVEIEGVGFDEQTAFSFGGASASVDTVAADGASATVTAPPHSQGLVDLVAESPDDSDIKEDAYLYRDDDAPDAAAFDPDSGPTDGGTAVEIRGWGLDASDLEVTFGGDEATIVDREESYAIVETPPGSVGPVDVVVSVGGDEIGVFDDAFRYFESIEVDGVSPSEGSTEGGDRVTVSGSGFSEAERVTFGGIAASFDVISDTEIEATTPAHGAGSADLVVEGEGAEARLEDGYTYVGELEVWGFTPARGAIAGGTYVEVRGSGFADQTDFQFGDEPAEEVEVVDDNNARLRTPPRDAPGEVDLEAIGSDQSAVGPYPYRYFNPMSRSGGASGGSIEGAINVSVLSTNGGPIENAAVTLSTRSDTPYRGVTDERGQVTLSGPDVYGAQMVTAAARGYSTATVEEVDAENVTLFLTYLDAEGGGGGGGEVPYGIVRGQVEMPGKVENPFEQGSYERAVVATTRRDIYSPEFNHGPGNEVIDSESYEIYTDTGQLAIVAVCGAYEPETDQFDPQFMGVERHFFVDNGQEYEVDIECDVPLDKSPQVKLVDPVYAPDGPNINRVRAWWDFGSDGVFQSPEAGEGMSSILEIPHQPDPEEIPDGMSYTFNGGSYTGTQAPFSQTYIEGVEQIDSTTVLPPLVDVPELSSPRSGALIEDQTVRFEADGPNDPDLYWVRLFDAEGMPVWEYVLPGRARAIRFPDFPDFSSLPEEMRPDPLDLGQVFVSIVGIRADGGFDYDSYSYSDLRVDAWQGYSIRQWSFAGFE
ncbi:MAG: IPT/TIG domain-containing protein [Persicimonas sp.]